ncbi:putative DNA repair protein RAD51 4 [Paratrimastix pyriformis]|uniref:DNA repair protein RAD51 4 n=1 Tax=Paratrimastix pyriformis TaxID=342808 RepID=A0ABQ8UP70_9EUKA|nr:putative DNA repair protein RAD51 4 [Paratrimastix pyriformis]|eukprot:GAFH01002206.1.p1 GENE.GAFH01002206.1~~GAFH01002206.1.p1  ORF type:complete len:292 (+),score=23.67 GAFH01002206.1:87-962(+)
MLLSLIDGFQPELLASCANLGLYSVEQFLLLDGSNSEILSKLSLSIEALRNLQGELAPLLAQVADASDLCHKVSVTPVISTGVSALDDLLGGGFATSEVTELVGPPASGKTQILLSAMLCLLRGDPSATVAYISPTMLPLPRLRGLLRGPEEIQLLRRVLSFQAVDHSEVLESLQIVAAKAEPCRLVCVESIGGVLASCLEGESGYVILSRIATALRRVAQACQASVLITNHTIERDGELRPALGVLHQGTPSVQIMLFHDPAPMEGENLKMALLTKSPRQPIFKRAIFPL